MSHSLWYSSTTLWTVIRRLSYLHSFHSTFTGNKERTQWLHKTEHHRTTTHYVSSLFAEEDDALILAQEEMRNEGVPEIHISASEGKMLHVLTLLSRAERILEIGTLGGYSAIWMARALPEKRQADLVGA